MEDILIECSPGVSGDMLLGAFYDLGVPKNIIEKTLATIGLDNLYNLQFRESQSCSIRGIKVEIDKIDQSISNKIQKTMSDIEKVLTKWMDNPPTRSKIWLRSLWKGSRALSL